MQEPLLHKENISGLHTCAKETCIEKIVVVCSAYFPSDAEVFPTPQQVRELIRDCEADGLDLLIGCDANTVTATIE